MYDMQESRVISILISHQDNAQQIKMTPKENFNYQNAVGNLLYLSCKTRTRAESQLLVSVPNIHGLNPKYHHRAHVVKA